MPFAMTKENDTVGLPRWRCSTCDVIILFELSVNDTDDKKTCMKVGVCECGGLMWVKKAENWRYIGIAEPIPVVPLEKSLFAHE